MAYERSFGPLDVGTRIEVAIAGLGQVLFQMFAQEGADIPPLSDFMVRWGGEAEPDRGPTVIELMEKVQAFTGATRDT